MDRNIIKASIIALSAKRLERSSDNLSVLQKQLFEQFSEFDLKQMSKGWYKGKIELKPLSKKTIIPISKTKRIAPRAKDIMTEPLAINTPPSPETLVGALQDTVHKSKGKGRPGKSIKKKKYSKPIVKKDEDV